MRKYVKIIIKSSLMIMTRYTHAHLIYILKTSGWEGTQYLKEYFHAEIKLMHLDLDWPWEITEKI